MSILIDKEKCIGCRSCAVICPGNLIRTDARGKACLAVPEDCWGCASCMKECRQDAISYYLGADIGGRGATMRMRRRSAEPDITDWIIEPQNGKTTVISVNAKDANKY